MNKEELLALLNSHELSPNKSLGQNFLVDDSVVDRIIEAVNPESNEAVLEIGPGIGAVTEALSRKADFVDAVEIDSGLASFLKETYTGNKKINIIHSDFLKINHEDKYAKIVSNLPYYCSSEILFTIAENYSASKIFVMLQGEMAERIASRPGSPSYGALTITLGLYYKPKLLFKTGRFSFYPVPDVSSSFLLLERKENIAISGETFLAFQKIVKSAFWGRRKTIAKALTDSPHVSYEKKTVLEVLESCGINPQTRGEELDRESFIKLAEKFQVLSGV